ncbi:MAG: acylneuraminate cytidylyltransferase family protein, partial [Methanosarcinales archaeon]|nr:acylneuraminate cytidylyltransferase family protein [Methanosarcinales archaeon]
IAGISKDYGAEVPFLRPKELSMDDSPTIDTILHVIDWFENKNEFFDILVLIEPTSPLRALDDINNCIEILLKNKNSESIVSIARLECSHPEFNVILNKEGFIRKMDGGVNFKVLRRQELKDVYYFDGSVYISYIESLKKRRTFYHEKTLGYIVPKYKALEIDDICDFIMVEALIKIKMETL